MDILKKLFSDFLGTFIAVFVTDTVAIGKAT